MRMRRRKLCPLAYLRTGMFVFVIAGAIVGGIAGAALETSAAVADTTSQDGS
jgi:hypothetical protein